MKVSVKIAIRNTTVDKQRILALNNIFDLQGHHLWIGNVRTAELSGFLAELIISKVLVLRSITEHENVSRCE